MNPLCPRCGAGCSVRHGRYHRHDDAQTIQRLTRRTWCTTKLVDSLDDVIAIYQHYHNTTLIPKPKKAPEISLRGS